MDDINNPSNDVERLNSRTSELTLVDPDPGFDDEHIQKLRNRASTSIEAKDYATAEPILQNIMEKSEDKYGTGFMWRDETMEMRAAACWELGKLEEANKLFDQQFKGRGKLMETLAKESLVQGKRNSAEILLNKHFEGRESIMELLAESYLREKKWDKAKEFLVQLLQSETDQTARLQRMHTLANVCFAQKDLREAEAWCLKAVIGRQTTLGDRHPQFYESITLLAQIYNAEGSVFQADSYEAVLADLSPGLRGIHSPQS